MTPGLKLQYLLVKWLRRGEGKCHADHVFRCLKQSLAVNPLIYTIYGVQFISYLKKQKKFKAIAIFIYATL